MWSSPLKTFGFTFTLCVALASGENVYRKAAVRKTRFSPATWAFSTGMDMWRTWGEEKGLSIDALAFLYCHCHDTIIELYSFRVPVTGAIQYAIDAMSGNELKATKQRNGYDDFYHVGMAGILSDGSSFVAEKNQRIEIYKVDNIWEKFKKTKGSSLQNVCDNKEWDRTCVSKGHQFTIGMMLEWGMEYRTRKDDGKNYFFTYDAFTANCQKFVKDCLQGLGMFQRTLAMCNLDEQQGLLEGGSLQKRVHSKLAMSENPRADCVHTCTLCTWMYQPIEDLVEKLKTSVKVASKGVTDFAAGAQSSIQDQFTGMFRTLTGSDNDCREYEGVVAAIQQTATAAWEWVKSWNPFGSKKTMDENYKGNCRETDGKTMRHKSLAGNLFAV